MKMTGSHISDENDPTTAAVMSPPGKLAEHRYVDDILSDTLKTEVTLGSSGSDKSTEVAATTTQPKMIGEYSVDYLVERAQRKIERRTHEWEIIDDAIQLPTLKRNEIEIGKELGEGGFFKVYEIQRICLENNDDESETEAPVEEEDHDDFDEICVVQNRRYMEKNFLRKSTRGKKVDCRYAFKIMKDLNTDDPGLYVNTLVDLGIEAKFLASLSHPNIIKMRAVSENFIAGGAESFIVIDRLYETLTERIATWKERDEAGFVKLFDFRGKKQKAFLAERLTVAFDIASALEYLHDRK